MLPRSLPAAFLVAALLPRVTAAAEGPASETARRPNHPPKFEPAYDEKTRLRVGRQTRVVMHADDPDGDALTFSVAPLPPGATFAADTGTLTWRPTAPGQHRLEFSVSDGTAVAQRRVTYVVGANRAPEVSGNDVLLIQARATPGASSESPISTYAGLPIIAIDPDADMVTVRARQLPAGARLGTSEEGTGVALLWAPTEAQAGEHVIAFSVSDGELTSELRRRIVVVPEWAARNTARWALLGGGPATFLTHGGGELFVGGAFDVSLAATRGSGMRAARCVYGGESDECAASHHRFYAEFEVLDSMQTGSPSLFTYGLGFSASLEWNPARRYLIPHYGVEIGGLVRSELGHRAAVRPYLGIHLFTSDDLWLNAVLGYRVLPAELVDLSGPTLGVKLVLAPW